MEHGVHLVLWNSVQDKGQPMQFVEAQCLILIFRLMQHMEQLDNQRHLLDVRLRLRRNFHKGVVMNLFFEALLLMIVIRVLVVVACTPTMQMDG